MGGFQSLSGGCGLLVRFGQHVSSILSEEGACYPHRNNLLQHKAILNLNKKTDPNRSKKTKTVNSIEWLGSAG
jgi:hypothetical protein